MADKDIQQIIKEQTSKLPEEMRNAIANSDISHGLQEIMHKHELRVDQMAGIENEVMLILLGLQFPDELSQNIEREAELTTGQAREIAGEIEEKIFLPLRDAFKELYKKSENSTFIPVEEYEENLPIKAEDISTPIRARSEQTEPQEAKQKNTSFVEENMQKPQQSEMQKMQSGPRRGTAEGKKRPYGGDPYREQVGK